MGKSALIASKIAATLTSDGTPSFSVSASDCYHGDKGAITKKEINLTCKAINDVLKNIRKFCQDLSLILSVFLAED